MAHEFYARRKLGSIVPIDAHAEEILRDIPTSDILKVKVTRPRNHKHSRKFHALLGVIFPHQDTYPTRETFRKAVHARLGYADVIHLPNDKFMVEAKSIAFDKMKQDEFEEFYDRAIELITTVILPGINREDVNREVDAILAGRENEPA